jgi:xanthosine utilization system XapX-like protein
MDEFSLASEAPPRWVVHLREPGMATGAGAGPAHLFSLSFMPPPGYPSSAPPALAIIGPLGGWVGGQAGGRDH